jgi:uncharacterized protein YpuA (DUF1002 family)
MKFAKKSMLVLMAVLVMGTSATPVMAHGSKHKVKEVEVTYSQCTVEDCTETGVHTHDGTTYCGHTATETTDSHETEETHDSHTTEKKTTTHSTSHKSGHKNKGSHH